MILSDPSGGLSAAVERAVRWSPFLAMVAEREPDLVRGARTGCLDLSQSTATADMAVARNLRLRRRALALGVALGDLAGLLDLAAVTALLTGFADEALGIAIRTAMAERYPGAEPRGLAAIALGKQGSRELNYSSDIDPILIFDPATIPRRAREDPEEAAVRIARRVVELLQARDGDGYVLRVDLRLRPSPEITPIAVPIDGAIAYYESHALAWERAAFIRARAAAGDIALGDRFLTAIRPFIWRRTLDFGAIGEIRAISSRIRDHHAQGQTFGPGYDLKRGRGGIREIEFFAQIHQLIHGGRDPALRVPATRDALAALAQAGRIDAADAAALADAYTVLRTIEHRVQMIDDRQTHRLPADADALDRVALLHGAPSDAALLGLLAPAVARVGGVYDALDDRRRPLLSRDLVMLEAAVARAGFADAGVAAHRIAVWRAGTYPALRSPAARDALEAVLPTLVAALGAGPDPAGAWRRLDTMIERMPSAINIFRLLEARPALAELLALVLAHAAPLADELGRRPALIDGLIDATAMGPMPAVELLAAEMHITGDYQAQLDHVRRIVGERRFALGVQVVAGASDPIDVAAGHARVAEAAVDTLAGATVTAFAAIHGTVPDSEFVILALGRFGGAALTPASDLDLVYLFTGDFATESDGAKPLGATLYYTRLASRVTAALSVATAAGPLYAIDTRLRPSGSQGPLVVSVDSFDRYQREDAWTWEHMALTRARAVFGSTQARRRVEAIVAAVLAGDRPARDVATEARAMRAEIARHKPPAGPLDAKLLPGGLVDLEFGVHIAQLTRHLGLDPRLGVAIDALVAAGAMPAGMRGAHDLLTRLLVTIRLVAPDAQPPAAATQMVVARALGLADWSAVVASLATARQEVATFWRSDDGTRDPAA